MTDQDNDDRKYSLSRRRALAGLGTIGAAAGLGGIGTFAQLTDTEAVGVSFSAGELDGTVEYSAAYNGEVVSSSGGDPFDPEDPVEDENGDAYVPVAYKLEDVQPGDYGTIVFGATVETNPAWPILVLGKANSQENGIVEPEAYAEEQANLNSDQDETESVGELGANLYVVPFYDTNVQSSYFDADGPTDDHLEDYGEGTHLEFWDNSQNGDGRLLPRSLDHLVEEDPDDQLRQGTVQWNANADDPEVMVATDLDDLDGDTSDIASFALDGGHENGANIRGVSPLAPGDKLKFGFDWHIPYDTGNEIQTDSVDVYFTWAFQQLRNSEGPQSPFTYDPGNYTGNEPDEGDDPTNTTNGS